MMIATTENSALAEDKFFNCLPEKLRCHLLPFQREGVAFGIERNGRYSHEHANAGVGFIDPDAILILTFG